MNTHEENSVRLNKFLAERMNIGRRQADELIENGDVKLNGSTAILGQRIIPDQDTVTIEGKTLSAAEKTNYTYIALNKPVGFVCSRRQQGDTPTIYSLLPGNLHHVKPVGRLDKDSSGLILLTNDGDYAHQMTHPSFHKTKAYQVGLNKPLQPLHRQMISDYGVSLPDGPSKLQLERLLDGNDVLWKVLMHEGRNRQIRRTFAALDYMVISLHRTEFGPYSLGELPEANYEVVTKL